MANFVPTSATVPSDPEQADSIGLYGANREYGLGEVVRLAKTLGNADNTDDTPVLKKGVAFKGDLNIVKMALKGSSDTGDANNPKKNKVTRTFVVYYKKEAMGSYSTLGGEPCTESDLSGCYFNQCQVQYQLDDDDTTSTNFDKVCSVSDCANYGSGGRGANCYQADESGKERTLVGCGGTSENTGGRRTTAIGYGAGKKNTGGGSTFIGFKAGTETLGGIGNTFLGARAGQNNTGIKNTFIGGQVAKSAITGGQNIAIGYDVQLDSLTDSNQINIGNIIKAKQKTDSDDSTKKYGEVNICNADGSECMPLSKKSLACPANHYFRGIYQEDTTVNGVLKKKGDPICQEENFCPQSLYHWTPENICHKCPRDSPLYVESRKNASLTTNCPTKPECCKCLEGYNLLSDGSCECPSDLTWDSTSRKCECPNGTVLRTAPIVTYTTDSPSDEASPRLFRIHSTNCYTPDCQTTLTKRTWNHTKQKCQCPLNTIRYEYNETTRRGNCICPDGTTLRDGECKCHLTPNGDETHYDNGICCPTGSSNNNGSCCPDGKWVPYDRSGGDFMCCYQDNVHIDNGICCFDGWRNDNGKCCPPNTYNSNGLCCSTGKSNDNGLCCEDGWHNDNGKCCPDGQYNDNGKCCQTGWRNIIGRHSCCPPNRVNNDKCCPVGTSNDNGKCCPDGWHNDNNLCCPAGQSNNNGQCCGPDWSTSFGICCPAGSYPSKEWRYKGRYFGHTCTTGAPPSNDCRWECNPDSSDFGGEVDTICQWNCPSP